MMTTSAAILGALPLALSFGDGGELRRPLGISIVGGLLLSQLLTLYTTPMLYLYLDRFRLWAPALVSPDVPRTGRDGVGARGGGMSRPGFAAILLVCAAASGCMVGPDYKRPDAPASPAFKELAGWKPGSPQDALDKGRLVVGLS